MILYRWQGAAPNFGDELNTVLWPNLLPNFFDNNRDSRFLGIGSVLDSRQPASVLKLVAGSGYGGYERKPVLDDNWVIHWVRGPRTAAALGLPASLALGDPALLLPLALPLPLPAAEPEVSEVGFMPHFESIARGTWQQAAEIAGITLIDPRDPPLAVVDAIRRCRLILSEALHGVIVADALRVPWIAVRPLARIHRAKWGDWSDIMQLSLRARRLPASSAAERVSARGIVGPHAARIWFDRYGRHLDRTAADRLTARSADALLQASWSEPQLSSAAALDRCQSRMMDALTALRRQPMSQAAWRGRTAAVRSGLRQPDDSAYQLKPTG